MKYVWVGFIGVGILLSILQQIGWAALVQATTHPVVLPIQQKTLGILRSIEAPIVSVPRWYRSQARLAELQVQYSSALARISDVERLERENEELRKLLSSNTQVQRIIAAPIVSYSLPTIAAGSEAGVQEGQLVYSSGTVLGHVTKISPRSAQITLLSSKNAEPILAETDTGVQGIVKGTGTRIILTQVMTSDQLIPGSRITAVGQPGVPPGAFLGTVGQITSRSSEPVTTATVDQITSFYTAVLVEVQ